MWSLYPLHHLDVHEYHLHPTHYSDQTAQSSVHVRRYPHPLLSAYTVGVYMEIIVVRATTGKEILSADSEFV